MWKGITSLQEESGLAGVDVEADMSVTGWVPEVKVVNVFPGKMVRMVSPVSGATLEP